MYCRVINTVMVVKIIKEVLPPAGEVLKKGRRRRRRAGSRASRRRTRLSSSTASAVASIVPEKGSQASCAVHAFLLKYQSAIRMIPAQLPPKVHAGPPSKRVKRVSWRKYPTFLISQHF